MTLGYERIKIGVEENGTTKLISNLVLDDMEYDLVDQGGETFAREQGIEAVTRLRAGDPDKNFVVIPD